MTFRTIGNDLVPIVDLIQKLSPKIILKKASELNQMSQDVWDIKLPWVEVIIDLDGKMYNL